MKVSTRNQLRGKVVAITLGNVMATIELVKATSVMIGKPD